MSLNIKGDIGKVWLGGIQMGKVYHGAKLIYTAEEKMADISVEITGSPATTTSKKTITSEEFWNLTEYDALTVTVKNNMRCYNWVSGSNHTKSVETYLVLSDGTKLLISTATEEVVTVKLDGYTKEQKATVKLSGTVNYSISDVTNKAYSGAVSATNVIAN